MRSLRFGIMGLLGVALALVVGGCDGSDRGNDAGGGADSGAAGRDAGTMPRPDSGPGVDAGGAGTDAGGGGGSCGPTGACQVSDATSCGAGQACVLSGSSATMWETLCIASGVLTQGEACDPTAQGQCAEGFQCTGPMGATACQAICCSNSDCVAPAGPGVVCQQIEGAGGAGFCRGGDSCSITDPDSCGEGRGCYPLGTEGLTQCIAAGTKAEGESCASLNDCVAGYGCVGDPPECRAYCNPDAPDCPDGESCAQLNSGGAPIPGVGACIVPAG